jgi:hypothetical protein
LGSGKDHISGSLEKHKALPSTLISTKSLILNSKILERFDEINTLSDHNKYPGLVQISCQTTHSL